MSSLLKRYEDLVRHNAPQISSVESGLRSLTYFLPGRFRDADMASEAIFAFVNLIGLYHDTILADAAAQQNPESGPNSSSFNRYTRAALRFSTVYKRVAYALTLIQFSEVLAEMGAIKVGGKRAKWKVVVLIEILKVACRLALLKLSKNRMLLHSSVPERDYDMANLKPTDEVQPVTWKGKRTGKEHVSLSVFNPKRSAGGNSTADQAVQYLLSKALVESIRTPLDLVSSLKDLRAVGEYLYVLRPLIYVLALRKFGAKSWKPWTISLIMELCSLASAINPSTGSLRKDVRNVEKDEYRRRMYSFIYYLLRSPFYERFTKARIDAFVESASKKPIISLFAGVLRDYQPLWEQYHFYTTGM